ncbi:MAG: glycerophosphodiester phosphodiesterase family protein [Acidobacteriota bacterium]
MTSLTLRLRRHFKFTASLFIITVLIFLVTSSNMASHTQQSKAGSQSAIRERLKPAPQSAIESSAIRERLKPAPQSAIKQPLLVAHRGASGYAPEHTLAAYDLAIRQGADFVEQDLQITKDGVLICMHDPEMSRTTNVKEVFPDRITARDIEGQGNAKNGWYVADFTLAEIKRLDAGRWFNKSNAFAAKPEYAGQKVPTLAEAINFIGNRAGLYIELKHFEFYQSLGFDAAKKLAAVLKKAGYAGKAKSQRLFIQSFSKACLLHMRELAPQYRRVQLLPMDDAKREDSKKVTAELAREIAEYAQGAGPSKTMLTGKADVDVFHQAGLVIHPYTFRGATSPVLRRPLDEPQANNQTTGELIKADIARFLAFGIDGGFTDYPALWRELIPKK